MISLFFSTAVLAVAAMYFIQEGRGFWPWLSSSSQFSVA